MAHLLPSATKILSTVYLSLTCTKLSLRSIMAKDISASAVSGSIPVAVAAEIARRPAPVVAAPAPISRSTGKSKKKKPSAMASASPNENTGRWTAEEHRLFLQGLEQHGKGWKKIASLIKSRTVVQIRTHAQKYFQKLAKARQNGEEGDVTMEGRGGGISLGSEGSIIIPPRRRRSGSVLTGTKRKAIQSVVSSAQRQGKKLATAEAASGVPSTTVPLPAVAPALAHFILPSASASSATAAPEEIPPPGSVTGAALEDSIFRFLTPEPPADSLVNDVARQAGANPITLPSEDHKTAVADGEVSPTGVSELLHPSWTDAKDTPSWYAKGADVDALLDVADDLDWLADSGDPNESYQAPPLVRVTSTPEDSTGDELGESKNNTSVNTLPRVESNMESIVPSLPSLFNTSTDNLQLPKSTSTASSTTNLKHSPSGTSILEAHLQVFDTPMEEHDFVTTILENATESSGHLPSLE